MAAIIKLENLSRHFTVAHEVVRAVDEVSLAIEEGLFVALIGPSGSGKSTMLNLIGGLDTPTSGRVIVDSEDIGKLGDSASARYRNTKIGFVFQDFHLQDNRTALENVELPLRIAGVPGLRRRMRAEAALDAVGLSDRLKHKPGELSSGERQRAVIARAIVTKPSIVLADEPTGNLDSKNSGEIVNLLEGLRKSHGMTLIVATHDQDIAREADLRISLRDGRIASEEPQ